MEKSLMRVNTKIKVEETIELEEKFEPASPTSQYFLSEVAKLYILCVFELEIPINSSHIYDFFNGVFLKSHPRFSCIPIEDKKGRKLWKKVEVNVKDHIKAPVLTENLTPEKYSELLSEYMSKIATLELDQSKPLWEVHEFNYPTNNNATSTLIVKFHHAVGDGASLMGIVFTCFKRVSDPSLPLTLPSTTSTAITNNASNNNFKTTLLKTFNIVPRFLTSVIHTVYDYVQTVKVVLVEDDRTPIRSGNTNMALPSSSRVCSVALPLNGVKKIKSILKVTVNDVIIAIMSFATRLYIQEMDQGRLKNNRMTASIVVNLRSMKKYASPEEMRKGNTWGNKISMIELSLPNLEEDDLRDPLKFIMKAHQSMKRKRTNVAAIYLTAWTLDAVRLIGGFQVAVEAFEKGWKNSSFMITNLIGPVEHMSIGNHPIKGFYFVPTGLNLSLTVSVMSYMEELRVGLVVENDFIDHQRLITCVEKAYHLILQAATASINSTP